MPKLLSIKLKGLVLSSSVEGSGLRSLKNGGRTSETTNIKAVSEFLTVSTQSLP